MFRMRSNLVVQTWEVLIPVGGGEVGAVVTAPPTPRAVLLIHPATGVPVKIYRAFRECAAEQGYATVTYGYRGTGGASGHPIDHPEVRMRDWMDEDVPAVTTWAQRRWSGLPMVALGHSVGGHALALNRGSKELRGFITMASHAGVTSQVPHLMERAKLWLIFNGPGPLTARLLGYFPTKAIGMGEDTPRDMWLEWAGWTRKRHYFFDDPSMDATARAAEVTGPVLAIGFTDDPWATPQQIDAITDRLVNAEVKRRTYAPRDFAVERIGHLDFLRPELRETLWPILIAWFDERIER